MPILYSTSLITEVLKSTVTLAGNAPFRCSDVARKFIIITNCYFIGTGRCCSQRC